MGLFEKFGLGRKARPVGGQLERGRPEEGESAGRNLLLKTGIFIGLLLITLLAFPRGEVYEYTVQTGDVWRQQTLAAPFDFPVYKDPEALEAERREVRQTTPPYFRDVPDAQERMTANRDTVAYQIEQILEAYGAMLRHRQQEEPSQAVEDSARYVELRRSALVTLSAEQWERLAHAYANRYADLEEAVPGEVATGPRPDQELLREAWELGTQLLSLGVLDEPLSTVETDEIIVRNEEERTDRAHSKDELYGLNEAHEYAREYFLNEYPDDPERAALGYALFRAIFQPSLAYMQTETMQTWQRKQERISPTRGVVQQDEVIVRKGERVSEETKRKLTSLERAQNERSGGTFLWRQLLGEFILTLATFLIFFLYLFFLRHEVFSLNRAVFLIALLFAGIIGLFAIIVRVPSVGLYVVPVAIASVQLTILFDSRLGLFGTLTLALIGGQILGFDLEYFLATFFAGMLGVFSVRDIKNRGQYFLSGGLVLIGYLIVLTGAWLFFNTSTERLYAEIGLVAMNSLFVVMAYPLLWVFERAFDVTTDLTLLELSDTNRKLLKELSLRAPGSFNHTLQVANLAEAAADRIGADSLLTRVGALYHDIGKMLKPEYFVENQRTGENPHDKLKPRMSALIIASHVKEGLEMGRQHNLPRRVLDFIPTHHGTSRIEYFYRKAQEAKDPDDPDVLESEFRYPGPRPNTRETGILMLADGVEAASRSLDDPTHKRLKALVDAIFQARIEDGQLSDTDLTFRDLRQTKETFLSMLMGIYHVRVKYPEQEEEDKKEQQSSTQEEEAQEEEAQQISADPMVREMKEQGMVGLPEQSVSARGLREEATEDEATASRLDEVSDGEEPAPPPAEEEATAEEDGHTNGAPGASAPPAEQEAAKEEKERE